MPKIWVGRTTRNGEKKGDGLIQFVAVLGQGRKVIDQHFYLIHSSLESILERQQLIFVFKTDGPRCFLIKPFILFSNDTNFKHLPLRSEACPSCTFLISTGDN